MVRYIGYRLQTGARAGNVDFLDEIEAESDDEAEKHFREIYDFDRDEELDLCRVCEPGEHAWHEWHGHTLCQICGVAKANQKSAAMRQKGETMEVQDLISHLAKYNPRAKVEIAVRGCPAKWELLHGDSEGCTQESCSIVCLSVIGTPEKERHQ